MKRTEKSKAKAGRRGKPTAVKRRAESMAGKTNQRTAETRGSTRRNTTGESCSQLVSKHLRTDADVQQGQRDLTLDEVITTIPKIDLDEEIVEKANHPDSSEAATQKVKKTVKITQIRDREHSDGFPQPESRRSMKSAMQLKTAATSRGCLP